MLKFDQQTFESSETGRTVISGFAVVIVITMVALNMPRARITQEVARVATPIAISTGVDGNWSVFAPDPRRTSVGLTAKVEYSDGSSARWDLPKGGALFGQYRDYRWLKWMEVVIQDPFRGIWNNAAQYIARDMRQSSKTVSRVTLTRHERNLGGPGPKRYRENERWVRFDYYTLDLKTGRESFPKPATGSGSVKRNE